VFGPYEAALEAVVELKDECLQGGRQDTNGSEGKKFRSTVCRPSWALVKRKQHTISEQTIDLLTLKRDLNGTDGKSGII
jgi:hypothetical protein